MASGLKDRVSCMVYQTSKIADESCKFDTNLDQPYFLLMCSHLDANEDLIILEFFLIPRIVC